MALVYATKNGDWSDTTVWNTGALPTVNDDVYPNGFTVNIDGTFTVQSIRNYADTGVAANGTFNALNGSNLTCTASPGVIGNGASAIAVYQFTDSNGLSSATLSGFVQPQLGVGTAAKRSVLMSGNGTLYVNGRVSSFTSAVGNSQSYGAILQTAGNLVVSGEVDSGASVSALNRAIYVTSAAVACTVVGSVAATLNTGSAGIFNDSVNGTVAVTGNVYGGGYFNNGTAQNLSSFTCGRAIVGPRVSVTGDVYGGNATSSSTPNPQGYAIESVSATITGNVYGGAQFMGNSIFSNWNLGFLGNGTVTGSIYGGYSETAYAVGASNGTITVNGPCYASAACSAVGMTRGDHILTGPFIGHSSGVYPVGGKFSVAGATTAVEFPFYRGVFPSVTEEATYNTAYFEDSLPMELDVRDGVTYGLESELEGSLVVPQAATVLQGVTYDDGTEGTLNIAQAVWNTPVDETFDAGSIGDKMKTVSTVPATAAQIIALR
jgi:hypothetical protein